MLLCKFSPEEIKTAIAQCNDRWYGGCLRFEVTRQTQLKRTGEWRTRGVLRFLDGKCFGARLSSSGRRTNSADWETHYDFMAMLFAQRPNGSIQSGWLGEIHYTCEADFFFKAGRSRRRDVGSIAQPRQFGDLSHTRAA